MQVLYENNKLKINYFLYEIVHHCNLNCKGCDHCSPIAEEEYVEIKTYKKDIENMKKLFDNIVSIGIMGGEPLLHPKLIELVKITRKVLKNTNILIFTNAIEIQKQSKNFWETLKKERASLVITKYNININFKEIEKIALSYGVLIFYENNFKIKDSFHKICFNENGNEDINLSYNRCYHAHHCPTLENGILYQCPIIPASKHFNKYFKKDLIITEKDGLDIHKKLKKEEVFNYFNSPMEFCRYCDMKERENAHNWGISKKDISEWT